MLEQLEDNPVVQTIAGQSPYSYIFEIQLCLTIGQVLSDINATGSIADVLRVSVRAFGGIYFLVPLILNSLPSSAMKETDRYALVYLAAVLGSVYLPVPRKVSNLVAPLKKLAYAIFISNACVTGVLLGQGAFPGSRFAPILLGFLAVNGGVFLEQGLTSKVWKREYSEDQLLSLAGPVIFLGCVGTFSADLTMPAVVARSVVVLFRLSTAYLDYNEALVYVNGVRISLLQAFLRALPKRK